MLTGIVVTLTKQVQLHTVHTQPGVTKGDVCTNSRVLLSKMLFLRDGVD